MKLFTTLREDVMSEVLQPEPPRTPTDAEETLIDNTLLFVVANLPEASRGGMVVDNVHTICKIIEPGMRISEMNVRERLWYLTYHGRLEITSDRRVKLPDR